MGYRDSDNSGFSQHGIQSDRDDARYGDRSHRETYDHGEPRTGYRPELDERTPRYDQYGMVRGYPDNRGDAYSRGWPERERLTQDNRYQGAGNYRVRQQGAYPGDDAFEAEFLERQTRGYGRRNYGDQADNWGADRAYAEQSGSRQQHHDPDYHQWRQEQMRLLDEDYDSWRKERYQKFSDDFNTWRSTKSQSGASTSTAKSDSSTSQSNPSSGKNKDAS